MKQPIFFEARVGFQVYRKASEPNRCEFITIQNNEHAQQLFKDQDKHDDQFTPVGELLIVQPKVKIKVDGRLVPCIDFADAIRRVQLEGLTLTNPNELSPFYRTMYDDVVVHRQNTTY